MRTILTLSPHLDDAVFSVGPLLAELAANTRIVVATAFTKSVADPEGFALACQLDKGLPASVDYMEIRRKEDSESLIILGVEGVHGPFAEAPHRGYQTVKDLFGPILPTDEVGAGLREWLVGLTDSFKPDVILLPFGIGSHIDHQWVRMVAEASIPNRFPLVFFKDQPYAEKSRNTLIQNPAGDASLGRRLHAVFTNVSLARALLAAEVYQTQIPFQFGGVQEMKRVLSSAWGKNLPLYSTAETPEFIEFLAKPIPF